MNTTSICNLALGHIGEYKINDISDSTPQARECNRHFEHVRDLLQREHAWNFATKLATLSQLSGTPDFRWSYKYALPSDYLAARTFNGKPAGGERATFEIMGGELLTDAETAELEYAAQVTDTTLWDAGFIETFSYLLAAKIATSITQSDSVRENMERRAEATLRKAKGQDARENKARIIQPWTNSRVVDARTSAY